MCGAIGDWEGARDDRAADSLIGGAEPLSPFGMALAAIYRLEAINQILERHPSGATRLQRPRTRRSSGRIFVQLKVRSPPSLTLADVDS